MPHRRGHRPSFGENLADVLRQAARDFPRFQQQKIVNQRQRDLDRRALAERDVAETERMARRTERGVAAERTERQRQFVRSQTLGAADIAKTERMARGVERGIDRRTRASEFERQQTRLEGILAETKRQFNVKNPPSTGPPGFGPVDTFGGISEEPPPSSVRNTMLSSFLKGKQRFDEDLGRFVIDPLTEEQQDTAFALGTTGRFPRSRQGPADLSGIGGASFVPLARQLSNGQRNQVSASIEAWGAAKWPDEWAAFGPKAKQALAEKHGRQ